MKKILNVALLFLLCCGAVSCDLNKYPSDALVESEGFLTFNDATEFRRGFYAVTRSCLGSTIVVPINIEAEGINPTIANGGQLTMQYNWNLSDNDQYIEALWTNFYSSVFELNYFLSKANELIEKDSALDEFDENKMSPKELEQLNLFIAEARFFRALLNRETAIFYCEDYDPATAANTLGIIISESADVSARLPRVSLEETYAKINEDLDFAQPIIDSYYAANSTVANYITPATVKAFKAKVLLDTHKYEECAALCEELVLAYPLIANDADFRSMWQNDRGSEIIFQFYASATEGGTSNGGMFLTDPYQQGITYEPLYVPSQWILDQYDSRDIRKGAYFGLKNTRLGTGNYDLYLLTKYPGNPAYNATASANSLLHNVRLYRSADFQLMAAECYANLNDLNKANNALKALMNARMVAGNSDYSYTDYSSIDDVTTAIRNERFKELFMEGNRIADLKRWNLPMSRLAQDPQNVETVSPNGLYLEIPAGDYRFVWPIPQSETSQNHAIKDQQNKGW